MSISGTWLGPNIAKETRNRLYKSLKVAEIDIINRRKMEEKFLENTWFSEDH